MVSRGLVSRKITYAAGTDMVRTYVDDVCVLLAMRLMLILMMVRTYEDTDDGGRGGLCAIKAQGSSTHPRRAVDVILSKS